MQKLIIMGFPEKNRIPYNDKDYDIWCKASALKVEEKIKRVDKVFEIHTKKEYLEDHYKYIYNTDKTIVLQKRDDNVDNQEIFPIETIKEKYGNYFATSASLMLVYADYLGYKNIDLYEIKFVDTWRMRVIEKSNFEYWIGYFRGKGLKINLYDCEETLCQSRNFYSTYFLDDIREYEIKIKKKENELDRLIYEKALI